MEAKKNGKLTMNHSNNPKSTSSGKGDSEQLFERYEHIRRIAFQNTLRLHFKRAAWVTVVRTTLLAKRLIDIIASVLLLMLLRGYPAHNVLYVMASIRRLRTSAQAR